MSKFSAVRYAALAFLLALPASLPGQELFWEPLREIAQGSPNNPLSDLLAASGGGLLAVVWQERAGDELRPTVMATKDGLAWTKPRAIGPRISLAGMEPGQVPPPLTAMAVDASGRILVATQGARDEVMLLLSADAGATFAEVGRLATGSPFLTPVLSVTSDGRFLLLVERTSTSASTGRTASSGEAAGGEEASGASENVSIAYSVSEPGGRNWSPLADLVHDDRLRVNTEPRHIVFAGRDYVGFVSRIESISRVRTLQLWLARSDDGGRSWKAPVAITDSNPFNEPIADKMRDAGEFNNFSPALADVGGRLALAWRRSHSLSTTTSQVYYCELDADGGLLQAPQRMSNASGGSLYAQVLWWKGVPWLGYVEYTDRYRLVLQARRDGLWGVDSSLASLGADAQSPLAVLLNDHLYLFWQDDRRGSLVRLSPDITVSSPTLAAVDFTPGVPSNHETAAAALKAPQDSSGIKELRYRWGREGTSPEEVALPASDQTLELPADEDGAWRLSVRAVDRAGNVSAPSIVTFARDTKPPEPVRLVVDPAPSQSGEMPSNTYTVRWDPPAKPVRGYAVAVVPLSDDPTAEVPVPAVSLVGRKLQSAPGLTASNVDNGIRLVAVSAQDLAGNYSPPSMLVLRLAHYVAVTYISRVTGARSEQEELPLSIAGRGFTLGGTVNEVILDRDKRQPWDYVFAQGEFKVIDDRRITGPTLDVRIDTGDYWIGVRHPVRPIAWSGTTVAWSSPGTVKFGTFSFRWAPRWTVTGAGRLVRHVVPFSNAVLLLVVAMLAAIAVLAGQRMTVVVREGSALNAELAALLEGRPSPGALAEREKKMKELQRRGAGLRLKFSALMIVLVVAIVTIVSAVLATLMISTERFILAQALENRVKILLDSAARTAAETIPRGVEGAVALAEVPDGTENMKNEALWMTITGPAKDMKLAEAPQGDRDYVWASNDSKGAWQEAYARGAFEAGVYAVDDEISRQIVPELETEVNQAVLKDSKLHGNIAGYEKTDKDIDSLARQLQAQRKDFATDPGYRQLNDRLQELKREINKGLREVTSARVGSLPAFDASASQFAGSYIFYRPVVFMTKGSERYYIGLVRIEVSTSEVMKAIGDAQRKLIQNTVFAALAAVGLGVVAAIVLAGITIRPIRKLARGVAVIRDTEDKEALKSHVIEVGTRDEIGTLAETVNEMTRGLVKAATENKLLLLGKDVQKMFLPLDLDAENRKGATGGERTDAVEIFGYYEGAKGVSGDSFDFHKLDATHYAIMKCDVAGKGVPAALIMVEVATLFLTFCRDWTRRAGDPSKTRIDTLVYTINDMLEERGFKGRFATLSICLLDTKTGAATVCNAGENVLHLYDADQGRMVQRKLPETPAAGVFPSSLVEMKSGFPAVKLTLDPGDALFLFTDGFEEAKRTFRDSAGEEIRCAEPGLKEGELHLGTHALGATTEEFGLPRIYGVVDAALTRRGYRLQKAHGAGDDLDFDFSGCTGSVNEAVMALVGIEKVFRLYRTPATGPAQKVAVDRAVDAFLKAHFRQYASWFGNAVDGQGPSGPAIFAGLQEDEQYDDLTLLVVRRPQQIQR